MTGKRVLLICLLVLVLVMVGGSLWFLFNSPPVIDVPEGKPIIATESSYTMAGMRNKMFIYEDGTVIYVEDKGLRIPTPENLATRTWKTGQLEEEELNSISLLFQSDNFTELEERYSWRTIPHSDLDYTISIDYQGVTKTVTATGYLTPDEGMTCPDMPYPLDEIYKNLRIIIHDRTEEVYREKIGD